MNSKREKGGGRDIKKSLSIFYFYFPNFSRSFAPSLKLYFRGKYFPRKINVINYSGFDNGDDYLGKKA